MQCSVDTYQPVANVGTWPATGARLDEMVARKPPVNP